MFRYLLAFIIMNSYYQSLGVPIPNTLPIDKSLAALASQCENKLLSVQINSTLNSCVNISVQENPKKKLLQCLMFYDINNQLCSAVGVSKIDVTVDFVDKIQKDQDADALCDEAKTWKFSNLTDFPSYIVQTKLFKHGASCGKVCGLPDVDTDKFPANYFCKYFKWGTELLNSQQSTSGSSTYISAVPETDLNAIPTLVESGNESPVKLETANEPKTPDVVVAKTTPAAIVQPSGLNESGDVKFDKSSTKLTPPVTPKQSSSVGTQNGEAGNGQEDPIIIEKDVQHDSQSMAEKKSTSGDDIKGDNVGNVVMQRPDVSDGQKVDAEQQQGGQVDADYHDDSEGNDVNDETGLDDIDGMVEAMPKEPQQNIKMAKHIIVPSNSDGPRDAYSPMMSDSFADDGDHFIPFFLTAVILVVFLYVLYHNKSKVTKVFFGLILEGRGQGGRRRNSRGHAYRRLDTLEQAMSANTAAPPSKIIY